MGDLRHLALVKFKEGAAVEELLEEMGRLVCELDTVKSFEWGQDVGSEEMLRQGFTHVFHLTFRSEEDYAAYSSHPSHVDYSGKFAAAIEKVLVFHYSTTLVKPSSA